MNVGDIVMVNDPLVRKKIAAQILDSKTGADGRTMYLIKTVYGEAWRREDVLEDMARGLVNG